MISTDVFALDDNELGCTSVASHQIDTGDHHPIKLMPYRTPIIYRDKIAHMVKEMEERGIVRPSSSPCSIGPEKGQEFALLRRLPEIE